MSEVYIPIKHWSYSSMMLFLRNPLQWKKQYVLGIFDYKTSPSALVGQGGHKALEFYYSKKGDRARSVEEGLRHINSISDKDIEWGKTGSRQKVIENYTQAMQFYWEEEPEFAEILAVEKSMTQYIEVDGAELPIPAKAISDLINRDEKGRLEITDHKFISSYSDPNDEDPGRMLQAMMNYHTVLKEYGEKPYRMVFNELKIGKNKDGSPQLQPYEIVFDKHPEYFGVFYQMYNDCTREACRPDKLYLPNPGDTFTGKESFEEYRKLIVTVEAPAVQHRTKTETYAEKKFVASATDMEENKYLTSEEKIKAKLLEFGMAVEMKETFVGPNVIKYTFKPSRGVKMSKFEQHAQDIAIAIKAQTIRVEAPVMGTDLVGVEVPNPDRTVVDRPKDGWMKAGSLNIPIGVNVTKQTIVKSLADMPHLLIAGTTGSGKSVMINIVIQSLIDQNTPDTLKMILIDPKRVELSQFKNIPHLLTGVIYDEHKASVTMNWLVAEMENRYQELEKRGYRTIDQFNKDNIVKMHRIVVVIDEFADLMLQPKDKKDEETPDIERCIVRLAQKARAIGIHLVLGTQRPSVDVITGLIKANLPTRIAFMTASRIDSQVILDQAGAEELTGKGDMLFQDPHSRGLQRLQGFYV